MILIPGEKYNNISIKVITLLRDEKLTALKSFYKPKIGDKIIGRVMEVNLSNIILDIKYFNYATLSTKNINKNVKIKEGDYLLCEIIGIFKNNISLTFHKKLKGYVYYIDPSKIPRLIGKNGSMLNLIKEKLELKITIGKNGYILINGDLEKIKRFIDIVNIIENNAQRKGLTDYISKLL